MAVRRESAGVVKRIVGAILLGLGTVFGLKGESKVHWATPPDQVISVEVDETAADPSKDL